MVDFSSKYFKYLSPAIGVPQPSAPKAMGEPLSYIQRVAPNYESGVIRLGLSLDPTDPAHEKNVIKVALAVRNHLAGLLPGVRLRIKDAAPLNEVQISGLNVKHAVDTE